MENLTDLLYLLLPIVGAFILLFVVCCCGKKVKDIFHIPKEVVLVSRMIPVEHSNRNHRYDSHHSNHRHNNTQSNHVTHINNNNARCNNNAHGNTSPGIPDDNSSPRHQIHGSRNTAIVVHGGNCRDAASIKDSNLGTSVENITDKGENDALLCVPKQNGVELIIGNDRDSCEIMCGSGEAQSVEVVNLECGAEHLELSHESDGILGNGLSSEGNDGELFRMNVENIDGYDLQCEGEIKTIDKEKEKQVSVEKCNQHVIVDVNLVGVKDFSKVDLENSCNKQGTDTAHQGTNKQGNTCRFKESKDKATDTKGLLTGIQQADKMLNIVDVEINSQPGCQSTSPA